MAPGENQKQTQLGKSQEMKSEIHDQLTCNHIPEVFEGSARFLGGDVPKNSPEEE